MIVALVTGTSTGIGMATALHLGRNHYTVYASMRNPDGADELREVIEKEGLDIQVLKLDVDDADAGAKVAADVLQAAGRIDVLVNNAGIGGGRALEETTDETWKAVFETNLFGAVRMIRAVLPSMRAQKKGAIVNVSSMGGRVAFPAMAAYISSKFALEAASEVLAQEVGQFNIRVAVVEPGLIITPMLGKGSGAPDPKSPYFAVYRHNTIVTVKMLQEASQPEVVAEAIRQAIETDSPKLRYPVGAGADMFIDGRHKITDEEWIGLGKMNDDEYFAANERIFGVDFRPPTPAG